MTASNIVTFELFGTPTAKGRPRFFNGRATTDAKTRAAEQSILSAYLHAVGSRPPHDGPVTVELVATFAPSMSWPKWKREAALTGAWAHVIKPDIDNLLKIIDGLNGRAWVDDSQITHVTATKKYGSVASTRIVLTLHPAQTKPLKETK